MSITVDQIRKTFEKNYKRIPEDTEDEYLREAQWALEKGYQDLQLVIDTYEYYRKNPV